MIFGLCLDRESSHLRIKAVRLHLELHLKSDDLKNSGSFPDFATDSASSLTQKIWILDSKKLRIKKKIFFMNVEDPMSCDSAPPLHDGVTPRKFDGLPSAGAAPAL